MILRDIFLYHRIHFLFIFLIDDQFYADSYGSGLLIRGVLLHFLRRYEEAHENFDEIINMLVQSCFIIKNNND